MMEEEYEASIMNRPSDSSPTPGILIDLPEGWQIEEVHDSQLIAPKEENGTIAGVSENVPESVEENVQLEKDFDTLLKETELLQESEEVCSSNEEERCKRRREDDDDEVDEHPALQRRKIAGKNLQLQAERMIRRGEGILPPVKVGDWSGMQSNLQK